MTLQGETILTGAPKVCKYCHTHVKFEVLWSNAGYYIGGKCLCGPYSRESDYFTSREEAEETLKVWFLGEGYPKSRSTAFIPDESDYDLEAVAGAPCSHEGCESTDCTLCEYPDGKGAGWLCFEHAKEHGFCWGCGDFCAGIESFDFSPIGLCDECSADLNEDEDFTEDEGFAEWNDYPGEILADEADSWWFEDDEWRDAEE